MKKRILYFDILRICATLMVVMIHISGVYANIVADKTGFIFGNILDSLSRIAVPIFVMISGAFMLDESKQISLKDFLKKYVLNLAIITVSWSVLFAVITKIVLPFVKSEPITLISIFDTALNGGYHMWYLYMTIGLYLLTPVLKLFVKKENKNQVLYLIVAIIALGFVESTISLYNNAYISSIASFFKQFKLSGLGYIAYYLLGWYLASFEIEKRKRAAIYSLGALSGLYTIVVTHILSNKYGMLVAAYDYITLNVLISAVALFVFVKQTFKDKNEIKAQKCIGALSKLTFGAYIIHTLVLAFVIDVVPESIFSLARILIIWLITSVISFVISFVASKIPFIKYFVKG